MQPLEGVLERRTVVLGQHVGPDLDHIVRTYTQNLGIERPMVNRAHCHAIRDDRFAAVCVLLDVRGIEQRAVPESAERALGVIGKEDPIPEGALMEALEHDPLRIPTSGVELREARPPFAPASSAAVGRKSQKAPS